MVAYLDHAATSPLRPSALEAMLPFLTDYFGNPSGVHETSRRARRAIDEARDSIAEDLGVHPGEVVFTSGGTESDNLAILGSAGEGEVLYSAIEHPAVLETAKSLGGAVLPVTAEGLVDLDGLQSRVDKSVSVVSVMVANNETGIIQPIEAVADLCRRVPGLVLHVDAVQAAGWLDPARYIPHADLISISGHKFGGPKGTGALVVKDGVSLRTQMHGGGQERERRSGTQNVAGIIGMATALREARSQSHDCARRAARLRDRLIDELCGSIEGATLTGQRQDLLPSHAHITFESIQSEALLVLLDQAGIAASAASACASGALQPSHVLGAMGFDRERSKSGIRFSLGWSSSDDDVDLALKVLPDAVAQLRGERR